jgi:hypothetical protein
MALPVRPRRAQVPAKGRGSQRLRRLIVTSRGETRLSSIRGLPAGKQDFERRCEVLQQAALIAKLGD